MVDSSSVSQAKDLLKAAGQDSILSQFDSRTEQEQAAFSAQIVHLNNVTPGGLVDYCERARKFLADSKNNVNPFDEFKPQVPDGV